MFSLSRYPSSLSRFAGASILIASAVGLIGGAAPGCRNEPPPDPRFDDPAVRRPNDSRKLTVVFIDGVPVPVESALMPVGRSEPPMPGIPTPTNSPNVTWQIPASWKKVPASNSMRLAEFDVPAAAPGAEGAELAVHFFGPSAASSIDEILGLWTALFDEASAKKASRTERRGPNESQLIEVQGTLRASKQGKPGGNAESKERPDWKLIGAVVTTAAGPYFLKLLGPREAVDAAKKDFLAMIDSLAIEGAPVASAAAPASSAGKNPIASPPTSAVPPSSR